MHLSGQCILAEPDCIDDCVLELEEELQDEDLTPEEWQEVQARCFHSPECEILRTPCATDEECDVGLFRPSFCRTPGVGETCVRDADCEEGQACDQLTCRIICDDDTDCPDSHVCKPRWSEDVHVCRWDGS